VKRRPLLVALLIIQAETHGDVRKVLYWIWGIVALLWAGWLGLQYLSWNFTHFVVTSDRVIFRTGVLSKHGVKLIGAQVDGIRKAEDRILFKDAMTAALRQGSISMVNALGSGILETRALGAFMPRLARAVLPVLGLYVGKLIIDAVFTRDYPMIQGVVLVTATAYIAINLLVDLQAAIATRPRMAAGA